MLTILLVAAAVAVFGGSTVAIDRAAARAAPQNRQLREHVERGIRELLPKDVVGYENRDYIVEGVIEYDEDSHRWSAARLVDETGERWMLSGIEQSPGGPVRFLEPTTAVSVSGYPPEELELGSDKYRMTQRGNATVTAKGEVGSRRRGQDSAPHPLLALLGARREAAPGRAVGLGFSYLDRDGDPGPPLHDAAGELMRLVWLCALAALVACKNAEKSGAKAGKGKPAPVAIEPIATPEQRCIATILRTKECKAEIRAEIDKQIRAKGGGDAEVEQSVGFMDLGLQRPLKEVCDPKQIKPADEENMKKCQAEADCAGFARCLVTSAFNK